MIRNTALLAGAGILAATFAAQAQNLPPPGNVNPGSMNSGAEQTGAPNQPRSFSGYGYGYWAPGYAAPYYQGYSYNYAPYGSQGAPIYGGGYYER